MSELANSYLSAYQGQVGDIQSQLNDLLDKDSIAFQAKEKANEVVEAVGSIKAFMGGQPVGQYLLTKGKAFIKDSGISKEGAEADVKDKMEKAVSQLNKELSLNVPLGTDVQFGNTYAEIH